jgi:hypothetical protein
MGRRKKRKKRSSDRARTSRAAIPDQVPNQIFVGVPWRNVRPKYERIIEKFRSKYPLYFVIVGRDDSQDAEDLFEVIKERITSSSYAVFDGSGGNANVSLEFGYAEALSIPRALYLSTHGAAQKAKDSPIIADLAGKKRNHYAQEPALSRLLTKLATNHAYTIRFERFLRSDFKRLGRGERRRPRALALKIIHCLDGTRRLRRDDIVQRLLADISRYDREEIDAMLRRLHRSGLIQIDRGRHAKVQVI